MNKRIPTVLFLFLAFIIVLFSSGCQHDTAEFITESTVMSTRIVAEQETEERFYSNATLEDNFCDNSIVVVMNPRASSFRGVSRQLSGFFSVSHLSFISGAYCP